LFLCGLVGWWRNILLSEDARRRTMFLLHTAPPDKDLGALLTLMQKILTLLAGDLHRERSTRKSVEPTLDDERADEWQKAIRGNQRKLQWLRKNRALPDFP
jgi:hypothetical protein